MAEKFPVPGSSIVVEDNNPFRGQMTALLMMGNLKQGYQGEAAITQANALIENNVTPRQLKLLIINDKKTPRKAVQYLEDPANRLLMIARKQTAKGYEPSERFHN